MPAQIDIADARFAYDGEHEVLHGVNLQIEEGSYVVILGHNGSGKSTLARTMNALIVPDEGSVSACGLSSADPDEQIEIRRHVGMVFQHPDHQMVTSIVADDVAFGPENLGIAQSDIVRRVDEALEAVAMTEYAQADPTELSGGQKQRVSIAGMLAMKPRALILDEASSMLDPRGRRGVRRVMRNLNERGMTIVHITHFMEDALDADVVHVMDKGNIVLSGTPDEVFSHGDLLRSLGLEQPFAMRLAHALRARGIDVTDTARLPELEEQICKLAGIDAEKGE